MSQAVTDRYFPRFENVGTFHRLWKCVVPLGQYHKCKILVLQSLIDLANERRSRLLIQSKSSRHQLARHETGIGSPNKDMGLESTIFQENER
jgi:hypothetical protein